MENPKRLSSDSFAKQWSSVIAAKGYVSLPNCLVFCQHNLGIDNGEFKTLAYLIACNFSKDKPWPSVNTIAGGSGSRPGTVRNHLRSLEGKGIIRRIYRTGSTSKYDLNPLIHRLTNHACINPIKKRTRVYSKINIPPYLKTNTKEKELKRRSKKNTGLNSIGEILAQKTRPP